MVNTDDQSYTEHTLSAEEEMRTSERTESVYETYEKSMQSKSYIDENLASSSFDEDTHSINGTLDRDLDRFQNAGDPVDVDDPVSDHCNINSSSSTSSSHSATLPTLHPLHTLHPSPSKSTTLPLPSSSSSIHFPSLSSPSTSPSPLSSSPLPFSAPTHTPSSPSIIPSEAIITTQENKNENENERKWDSMSISLHDSVIQVPSESGSELKSDRIRDNRIIDGREEMKSSMTICTPPLSSLTYPLPLSSLPLLSLPPPSLLSHPPTLPITPTTTTSTTSSISNSYQIKTSPYTILHKSTDITPLQ